MTDFEWESGADGDVEYQIDMLKNEPDDIAYGLHSKLSGYIGVYNQVRLSYKAMATTWMGATGLGMLYLLSGEESKLPIGTVPAIALFGLLSLVGVLAIFYWDIFVYTRHLHAVYDSLTKLESKFRSLPNSFLIQRDLVIRGMSGPEVYEGYLYSIYASVLLIVIGSSIFRYFFSYGYLFTLVAVSVWSAISVTLLLTMILRARSCGPVWLGSF